MTSSTIFIGRFGAMPTFWPIFDQKFWSLSGPSIEDPDFFQTGAVSLSIF